jgi:hypothetical protein
MAQIPKFNITALAPQVKDNHNPLDWTISINSTRSLLELTSGLHDIALLMQTCRYVLEHRFHAPVKGRSAGNQAKRSTLSEICDCDTNVLQPTSTCGITTRPGSRWTLPRESELSRTHHPCTKPASLCRIICTILRTYVISQLLPMRYVEEPHV